MSLILAIESDRRQAARITAIARDRLNVELIVTESAEKALEALTALAGRTPDLILTPQLMSPKDESAINDRLRELDAAGLHVQTLMIPVLASSGKGAGKKEGGLLSRLRRGKGEAASSGEGCDPEVFATQVSEYLQRAAEERAALATRLEDEREYREAREPLRPTGQDPIQAIEPQPLEPSEHEPEPAIAYRVADEQPLAVEPERPWTPPIAEPFQPPAETPVESAAIAGVTGSATDVFHESMLASIDPEPVSAVTAPVTTSERPDMMSFLDSMLDPVATPVTPPDGSRDESHIDAGGIDVSGIYELDDVVVSDSNRSADELMNFEEAPPPAPKEEPRAVSQRVDVFAKEAASMPPAEAARDMLAEFIEFDELGVMDGPSVSLGEFAALGHGTSEGSDDDDAEVFAGEAASQATRRASSVLDAIELLDGPELSDSIDYRQEPMDKRERRAVDVAAASARTTAALETFFGAAESEPAATSEYDFDGDLFTPLPVAAQHHWPRPQGPTVKAAVFETPAFDAPADPGVEFAPTPTATTGKKKKAQKPAQDEWGLFDPAQCGFAALLEKLNEVTDKDEADQLTR